MEVDNANFFDWVALCMTKGRWLVEELVVVELTIFKEQTLTIQNSHYDRVDKKL